MVAVGEWMLESVCSVFCCYVGLTAVNVCVSMVINKSKFIRICEYIVVPVHTLVVCMCWHHVLRPYLCMFSPGGRDGAVVCQRGGSEENPQGCEGASRVCKDQLWESCWALR